MALRHHSAGVRQRHAIIAADPLLFPPAALPGAGVPVPRPRCGGEPRHRLRGRGLAAVLNSSALEGARLREIDHYSFPALGLSRGHFVRPFVPRRAPVVETPSTNPEPKNWEQPPK